MSLKTLVKARNAAFFLSIIFMLTIATYALINLNAPETFRTSMQCLTRPCVGNVTPLWQVVSSTLYVLNSLTLASLLFFQIKLSRIASKETIEETAIVEEI